MAIEQLERASIGRPLTRGGVSLFPIYIHGTDGLDIAARPADLTISEPASAEAPTITVTTPGGRPTLLVEGETVTGGQQNRVLNVSVLVPAASTIEVPVSCVEAGRWNGRAAFERGRTFAPRRVRRVKTASVAAAVQSSGRRYSDQGAVWEMIDYELHSLAVPSSTRAFHDAEVALERDGRAEALSALTKAGPLPGQCGIVFAHGGRVVAVEIFATAELLAANWEGLVRAALLDSPVAVEGRPSVSKALRFVNRLATGSATRAPGVGLGEEAHIRTSRLVGQALLFEGGLVHASAFALAA
ncbi:MAG: ARPP-1 family domain-containing protein [Acidimicrobiia bacterium]